MQRLESANLPTKYGMFKMYAYGHSDDDKMPHIAFVHEKTQEDEVNLCRLHSECFTGDVMGSKKCDCGAQLELSLQKISKAGGILVYLRQEGRGIGLVNKIRAYRLQDSGLDTVEANVHLGFEPDERSYDDAIFILKDLGFFRIELLTNNPDKMGAFENSGVYLVRRHPLIIEALKENEAYLGIKRSFFGHLFDD